MVVPILAFNTTKYFRVVFWGKRGKPGLVKGPVLPPITPGATVLPELVLWLGALPAPKAIKVLIKNNNTRPMKITFLDNLHDSLFDFFFFMITPLHIVSK
jgi:hypothetical protein